MRNLILAPGRILCRKIQQTETKRDSGIVVLRGTKSSIIETEVVKVGAGTPERQMPVAVGDHIFFKKGAEMEVDYQDEKYWMLDWNSYLMIETERVLDNDGQPATV